LQGSLSSPLRKGGRQDTPIRGHPFEFDLKKPFEQAFEPRNSNGRAIQRSDTSSFLLALRNRAAI
jgi:hypothetical protein